MVKRPSRWLAALCASVLAVHASGCFGSFSLTRKIYDINQGISENKFVRWLVFLAFTILPVYGVGTFVDAVVLNSLEFWTGSNPLGGGGGSIRGASPRAVRLSPTETLKLSRDGESGVMRVELEREGQELQVRYFEPLDDGMVVRDEAGALLLRARERADGSVEVSDASGSTVTVHSHEAVAEASAALMRDGVAGLARHVTPQLSPMRQGLALTCSAR
jgi:hypothetical protein